MTNSTIENVQIFPAQPQYERSPECMLKWRRGQLLVSLESQGKQPYLPALENEQRLVECLQNSPVGLIRIDPALGEAKLKLWADACEQAEKPVFLRIPSAHQLLRRQNPVSSRLKRLFDWSIALLLLLILSPLMLGLSVLIIMRSPGPIFFTQWRVGKRGKLFRIFKFRTMTVDAEQLHHVVMGNQPGLHKCENDPRVTSLGHWMRKYSLDELPQLFNVLRGEMSLVGPRPWALYDAVRIRPEMQHRLNALPGITGIWQVTSRSNLRDLDAVNLGDLEYLSSWSLWKDMKILLLTVPRIFSGFGAY